MGGGRTCCPPPPRHRRRHSRSSEERKAAPQHTFIRHTDTQTDDKTCAKSGSLSCAAVLLVRLAHPHHACSRGKRVGDNTMHAGSLALGAPRPRLLVPRGRGACNNTRQFFLSGIKTSWHTKCANSSFLGPRHHGILKCANSSFLGSRHHGILKCANSPFETPL